MRSLAEQPMDAALLEKSKLKILLQNVQGYESNANISDYYASEYVRFRKNRYFENVEEKIEAVTIDDINQVVKQHLPVDKAITIFETPTLTYTQFYTILSLIAILILSIIIAFYMKAHTHYKSSKP